MKKEFYVVIEKDENGFYVGEVPALEGCYAQGRSIEELMHNMRDVIEMCIEEDPAIQSEFIGVQKVRKDRSPVTWSGFNFSAREDFVRRQVLRHPHNIYLIAGGGQHLADIGDLIV